ncbi:MAG: hypothetical protein JW765_07650 [Deltaproteobacteria bacterium]|nr:hypothetical protein [Candidatus Zymogenaceae bacterium]
MILTFEIITFVLTGVLIYHSLKVRGAVFTLLFFLSGAVLGVLRENIVARLTGLYAYNPDVFTLWVGAAPAILAVFWSFSVYISLTLSERLVHGDFLRGQRVASIILLSMVFMGAWAASNEAMASIWPMVLWKFVPDVAVWGGAPLMVVFGYAGLSAIMLVGVSVIHRRDWKGWVKVTAGILSTVLMIGLHLAWIALVRAVIGLFV